MNFDTWRKDYDSMTTEDQKQFHDSIESVYPDQAHFNYENVSNALELVRGGKVLEFGPWKGDLAQMAIPEFNIKEWTGIEISSAAIEKTKCNRPEFKYILPESFTWWRTMEKPECDMIIATHFIEHLSNEHFKELIEWCKGTEFIYLEAPLSQGGDDWTGYEGTHKLTMGWEGVEREMGQCIEFDPTCKLFRL